VKCSTGGLFLCTIALVAGCSRGPNEVNVRNATSSHEIP
jgi:hypothetical protein